MKADNIHQLLLNRSHLSTLVSIKDPLCNRMFINNNFSNAHLFSSNLFKTSTDIPIHSSVSLLNSINSSNNLVLLISRTSSNTIFSITSSTSTSQDQWLILQILGLGNNSLQIIINNFNNNLKQQDFNLQSSIPKTHIRIT